MAGPSEHPVFLSRRLLAEGWRSFRPGERAVVPVLLMHLPNVFPGLARIAEVERVQELVLTMPAAQLAEVVKRGPHIVREIDPETVRGDRAFRGELAQWLAWHPEVLNGDSPSGDAPATT